MLQNKTRQYRLNLHYVVIPLECGPRSQCKQTYHPEIQPHMTPYCRGRTEYLCVQCAGYPTGVPRNQSSRQTSGDLGSITGQSEWE